MPSTEPGLEFTMMNKPARTLTTWSSIFQWKEASKQAQCQPWTCLLNYRLMAGGKGQRKLSRKRWYWRRWRAAEKSLSVKQQRKFLQVVDTADKGWEAGNSRTASRSLTRRQLMSEEDIKGTQHKNFISYDVHFPLFNELALTLQDSSLSASTCDSSVSPTSLPSILWNTASGLFRSWWFLWPKLTRDTWVRTTSLRTAYSSAWLECWVGGRKQWGNPGTHQLETFSKYLWLSDIPISHPPWGSCLKRSTKLHKWRRSTLCREPDQPSANTHVLPLHCLVYPILHLIDWLICALVRFCHHSTT